MMPLTEHQKNLLCRLYYECTRSLDKLPYTEEFDTLVAVFQMRKPEVTHYDVWDTMMQLRKAGKLTRPQEAVAA